MTQAPLASRPHDHSHCVSHALAEAKKRASALPRDGLMAICLSGRGDKDLDNILAYKAKEAHK